MPSVDLLFGPLLIGVYLNTILYGVLLVQSFIYYRTYRDDKPFFRYFVLYLVICDTLNTVFDIAIMYEPLVFRYGTPRAIERIPLMLSTDPITTVVISTSVQLFICWRIKIFTRSWTVPCFIGIFVFCSLVGAVATSISSAILFGFAQLEQYKGAVITWLVSSAIADISISLSLVRSLTKRRTGHSKSDGAIDRIIRLTVHTGTITALFATMDLILFVAFPNTSLNFAFDFPLAKLYTNSLLSTLNARARSGWDAFGQSRPDDEQSRPDDNVLFGPTFWGSNNGRLAGQYIHNQKTIRLPNASSSTNAVELTESKHTTSDHRRQVRQADDCDVHSVPVLDIADSHRSNSDV